MNELIPVSGELLRLARVRLHVVAMLLHRDHVATMFRIGVGCETCVTLYTDASPQWKGLELQASSYDLTNDSVHE